MPSFGKSILQSLSLWLQPPAFADRQKTQTARLLYFTLWWTMGIITLGEAVLALLNPERTGRVLLIVLSVNLVCLVVFPFVQRGKTLLAGCLLIGLLWGLTTWLASSSGGVRSPVVAAYFILIVISGITMGGKAGLWVALATCAGGLGLVGLSGLGWLQQTYFNSDLSYWFQLSLLIAIMVIAQDFVYRSVRSTNRDIQQEMEHKLQAQQRFRTIFDSVNDAIFILDPTTGAILEANQRMCETFGCTPDEALHLTLADLSSGESPLTGEHAMRWISRAASGGPQSFEWHTRDKSGRPFWVEVNLKLTPMDGRDLLLVTLRDITEQKKTNQALQEGERKFRELFQANRDGIAVIQLQPDQGPARFLELNRAAHEMLGYTRDEMLQLLPSAIEPDLTPEKQIKRQCQLETGGLAAFDTVLIHKDGRLVDAEFAAQVVQYGGQLAVMNIVRDISDRKQHERELQAISSLSAAMRTAPTRGAMLPIIVEKLGQLLQCQSIVIQIIDPLTREAVYEAARGPWSFIEGTRQPPDTGLNAVLNQTLKPYHNNHIQDDPRLVAPDDFQARISALAGTLLMVEDKIIGYIWIGRTSDISESQVRILAAVADIAANAIRRATLHDQTVQAADDLSSSYDTTLEGWARALELRDHDTEGHTRRVVQMALDLAQAMGIGPEHLEDFRRGALLHDIGKIGIPDSILLKPGPLDTSEWELMRRHPEYAQELLQPIAYLHTAMDIPLWHHEKWDGTGYPRGLKGEAIPLAARIFALADVWDALISDRPYRKAWPIEKALEYISSQSGSHFDPQVVEVFLRLVTR
jgi:PAS domain S-box-containing protein